MTKTKIEAPPLTQTPAEIAAQAVLDEWHDLVTSGQRHDSPYARRILAAKIVKAVAATRVDVTAEELAGQIAVGVHTGLRKGSEAPSSADLWQAISKSEDSAWTDAAHFCAYGLESMGYTTTRDPE